MATGAELLHDVGHDAGVRGRRGGQHGNVRPQRGEQVADAAVVGTEVVAPVADAVGLVDHQQATAFGQVGQLPFAEGGVVQPLGADQQQVDLVGLEPRVHLAPLGGVRGVDGHRPDPGPGRRRDLVAHQRQQRRDDHGRPGALLPQQRGGHEVHRRLAPARALHHQCALPVGHQRGHRLELALVERGVRAPHQPPQHRQRGRLEPLRRVHPCRVRGGSDSGPVATSPSSRRTSSRWSCRRPGSPSPAP